MDKIERSGSSPTSRAELTLSERLAAEGELLKAIPDNALNAVQEKWRHFQSNPQASIIEIGSTAALGCAVGLATRNPAIFGESFAPVIPIIQRYGGAALLGASMGDLSCKTAVPIAQTWMDPDSLHNTKKELGHNLGNAVFDYSVNGLAFGAGVGASGRAAAMLDCTQGLDPSNRFCFANANSPAVGEHQPSKNALDDLILKAQRFKPSDLPRSIRLSGSVIETKATPDTKTGDVVIHHCETKNRQAVRFVGQVNVGDNTWVNIDLYNPRLHQAIHGMNTFHLNEKKPFFQETVARQIGREARLDDENPERIQYRLVNGIFVPRDYRQKPLPDRLLFSGDVHHGAQRPLHDAQSIPAAGNIWFKFHEFESSRTLNNEKPTKIFPMVSTGELYFRLHPEEFGRMKYPSVRTAEERAIYLKAGLNDRVGATLTKVRRNGEWGYTFE